ncbi:hypothetical protein [Burkholderia sp. BCC1977]|uniref:hypothetical protein n=1 Tax=Burkholderia sp. BCC1977 TaxID=2817440 RepID=UPI002ABD9B7F|nr:hypothetical protein [Burkholderia sp. BCC1977]
MSRKNRGRTPISTEMLLPLPVNVARGISLENHLALATLKAGHGNKDAVVAVMRVLYMTWFMLEKTAYEADVQQFLDIESALEISVEAAERDGERRLSGDIVPSIERMLLCFDQLIRKTPKYRYQEAWARMCRFADSDQLSPLPGSRMERLWQ